jgi:hypothetical protein
MSAGSLVTIACFNDLCGHSPEVMQETRSAIPHAAIKPER